MIDSILRYFVVFIPMFMMLLGIILMVFWIKQRHLHSMFWFALAEILVSLAIFTQISIVFDDLYHWYFLLAFLYLSGLIALSHSIALCFDTKISWKICVASLGLLAISIFYFSFITENFIIRHTLFICCGLIVLLHRLPTIIKTKKQDIVYKALKLTFVILCLVAIIRLVTLVNLILTSSDTLDFISPTYWLLAHSAILILSMLLTALLVAINIKYMLSGHQVELENIKLQERLQISHDLHDILGSSLVRSMSIVSQSKDDIDNQKFLSMLKLLRDDLRQIIDNGVNTSTDIPQTPILWGAPVRHRFSQIFTELGIHSTWDFTLEWQSPPNTMECLTVT